MAFQEYNFLDIEYNEDEDTVKVTIDVVDDIEDTVSKTFVLDAEHFKGKGFNVAARNARIKQLVKLKAKSIHEIMVVAAARKLSPPVRTKIPPFAKGVTLD